ncbi:tail sheath protein [Maribacter phage Molly_5]|uniref:Tail sheath protein n=1 Tax=Maribacter phage Molly_1 TaxID=2745685 RepID=A0A8E4UYK2_9CAUD|nr:tail sheath protein [Maribacter phage Molly_1]QQO97770.1 tail sheath protein [Maribacter phage Molly_2]QQO97970.1 tail sheath protein [Maribacter phage Molly_3]QQO98170.1 tail sheath protein [Maribacter phage Molly_4]QQO98370.1 tail sheath protein [Maribacter phage Molly_5]QQO97570.1 tail sheath protein [Maribacter phage Molly_1]
MNIGSNIREESDNRVATVNPAPLYNIAIVGKADAGPLNKAVLLADDDFFYRIFGRNNVDYAAHIIRGIFQNVEDVVPNVYFVRDYDPTEAGDAASVALTTVGTGSITVSSAYFGDTSPGADGNKLRVVVNDGFTSGSYYIEVYKADSDGNLSRVETTPEFTISNIKEILDANSQYITATSVTPETVTAITAGTTLSLTSGADPDDAAEADSIANLAVLENKKLQYIIHTDHFTQSYFLLQEAWARKQKVLPIISASSSMNPASTFTEYSSLLVKESFNAGYFNWGYVSKFDEDEGEVLVPLIGHIFGAYYVNNRVKEGSKAHEAPGGMRVTVRGINSLQHNDLLTPTIRTSITRSYGWNVINFEEGFGIVVQSSRTMSTANHLYSIHIRTAKNYLIQSFADTLKFYQQKGNNPKNRLSLTVALRSFLRGEYDKGMFEVENGFEGSVGVICDETNNGKLVRQQRQMQSRVKLVFTEIAEEVTLALSQSVDALNIVEQ